MQEEYSYPFPLMLKLPDLQTRKDLIGLSERRGKQGICTAITAFCSQITESYIEHHMQPSDKKERRSFHQPVPNKKPFLQEMGTTHLIWAFPTPYVRKGEVANLYALSGVLGRQLTIKIVKIQYKNKLLKTSYADWLLSH